ncbi:MAG TPA: hypothetical protein VKV18_14480 [Chthonomonas sp.]|uniref:hypothetical protein n=1 Tax=Chthonomonas sp. TaxID=2282153 RepID=UPI002B4B1AFE|nr:hypothetical protein [Chthonomonas sp.]HLI49876.1 hypothetical protein [Chthonomonas sp.]
MFPLPAAIDSTQLPLGMASLSIQKNWQKAPACAELPRLNADLQTASLKEIDSQLLQQALRDLEQALKQWGYH